MASADGDSSSSIRSEPVSSSTSKASGDGGASSARTCGSDSQSGASSRSVRPTLGSGSPGSESRKSRSQSGISEASSSESPPAVTSSLDSEAPNSRSQAGMPSSDSGVLSIVSPTSCSSRGVFVGRESPLMVGAASVSEVGATDGSNRPLHSLQNQFWTGFMVPQWGHLTRVWVPSSSPHSLQNLLPSLLAVPHFGQ